MSWLLSLLGKVLPALAIDATTRLVQAARESLRPKGLGPADRPEVEIPLAPPPIGDSGVSDFMRGVGAADAKHELNDRNAHAGANLAHALDDDEARAEGIEQALSEQPSRKGGS